MKKVKGAWKVGNTITIEKDGKKFERKVSKDKTHGEFVKVDGKFVGKEELMPKKEKPAEKSAPKSEKPVKKTASKKAAKKADPDALLKTLTEMKGGDRIAPKDNEDDWYLKMPKGVYEGRFESHATGDVLTAEELAKKLGDAKCEVFKRKKLLLESFRDDIHDEDTYTIPSRWIAEVWLEAMEKLSYPEDKDGYRYYLYTEGDDYILTTLALEFE